MRAREAALIGAQRDVRVAYHAATDELYAATTLSAACAAWFAPEA